MKQQIDNLIANTLLDEKELFLPNIGSLILRRNPAKRLSSKKLQRPYFELVFTSEERGVNIVLLISKIANVSEERASDIYAEWLEQSKRNEVTTIEGVCCIKNRVVTSNEIFEAMVNPNGRDTKKIKPRISYRPYLISGFLFGVAFGAATAYLHSNGSLDELLGKEKSSGADVVESTTPAATKEESQTIEQTPTQPDLQVVESIAADTTTPTTDQIKPAPEDSLLAVSTGKSYAVWGVYDELKNAEKYLLWLKEKFPNVKANIYIYDARYMVALCEMSSRDACNKRVAAWKKRYKSFKNVWVYTR
jgi:hypothetical protein